MVLPPYDPVESALWVNGTDLNYTEGEGGLPTPPYRPRFPYARLAGFLDNTSYSSLYHQMNSTTFAIDNWNTSDGTWTTELIHVDLT